MLPFDLNCHSNVLCWCFQEKEWPFIFFLIFFHLMSLLYKSILATLLDQNDKARPITTYRLYFIVQKRYKDIFLFLLSQPHFLFFFCLLFNFIYLRKRTSPCKITNPPHHIAGVLFLARLFKASKETSSTRKMMTFKCGNMGQVAKIIVTN